MTAVQPKKSRKNPMLTRYGENPVAGSTKIKLDDPQVDDRGIRRSKNELAGYRNLTVRLTVKDWQRLDDFTRERRESMQRFVVDAISKAMEAEGEPPLNTNQERKPRW